MSERERWMRLALQEAKTAGRSGEVPVGAVVVQNNSLVCTARNRREELLDPTAHAEILALREAARILGTRRLGDCTLYVTLEPCSMCAGALMMAELGECVFAARDERQGCCESIYAIPRDPVFYHRVPCIGGILEKEASELLKQFFENRRIIQDDH